MKKHGAVTIIGLCALLLSVMSACSAPVGVAADGVSSGSGADASFSGPWRELFASTYAEGDADEKAALADEVITDQEYAYFQNKIVSCMKGIGIDASWNADKSLSYNTVDPDNQDPINNCMKTSGLRVVTLRDTIERNPTDQDENEIMAACLRRTGVAPQSYSASDFANQKNIKQIIDTPEFGACNADPLGYKKDE